MDVKTSGGPFKASRWPVQGPPQGGLLDLDAAQAADCRVRTLNADRRLLIVGAVFGLATLLSAAGLITAGKATMQSGRWRDWRRVTPLVTGIWALALVGLVFTPVMPLGVAIFGLCFLALYTSPAPATTAPASARAQGA